jgi:hypothetical protein
MLEYGFRLLEVDGKEVDYYLPVGYTEEDEKYALGYLNHSDHGTKFIVVCREVGPWKPLQLEK